MNSTRHKLCFWLLFLVLVIPSCGKRKNAKLAKNYYKLAMLELSDGQQAEQSYKKALSHVDSAIKNEQTAKYMALKATLLFKLGFELESRDFFAKALGLCQESSMRAEIMNNHACLLAASGKDKEALSIWKILEGDKNYLTPEVAFVNQGKLHTMRNDFAQAKKCFSKAVYLAPNFLDAHYYLSLTCFTLGDVKTARNELKTVLYFDAQHQGARRFAKRMGMTDLDIAVQSYA